MNMLGGGMYEACNTQFWYENRMDKLAGSPLHKYEHMIKLTLKN